MIFTDTQRAYGDHADYNIDDAVVVLTGKNLRMTTANDIVTARDSLEYWERRQQAVARGDGRRRARPTSASRATSWWPITDRNQTQKAARCCATPPASTMW